MAELALPGAPVRSVPPGAVDCHHHIYDARYPVAAGATLRPPDASIEDYREFKARLGLSRHVVVQPSTYGVDNRCLLAALRAFGPSARGVAVCDRTASDACLMAWHTAGVRGLRFNLSVPGGAAIDDMTELAERIAPLGWHVQVVMPADELVRRQSLFDDLACPIVFDHFAHIPQPEGMAHPAYTIVRDLLVAGRAWLKLSGIYLDSRSGPPDYSDTGPMACSLIAAVPERLLWGSDWPHPSRAANEWPDDARLLDLLGDWVPDEPTRKRILVDNPGRLYGFDDTQDV